jgi:AraC-like DNA-binding protein
MASRLRAPSATDMVPCSYALNLVELVARWGIPPQELLLGSCLAARDLEDPSGRIPLTTMNALVGRARDLTEEPGLGFYLGMQKRVSMYGYLGFATMSASNLRECLELAVKFVPILTSAVGLRLCVYGGVAALVVEEHLDMGDVSDIATLTLVVGLWHLGTALTGRDFDGVAELAIPKPSYYPRFAHLLKRVRFGQPATRLVFDAAMLDVPLAMADPAALRLARAECERALEALGFDKQIGGRVRRAIVVGDRFRTFDEVAADLHVSRRTLARRLDAHGLSFSALLESERCDRALALLSSPDVSLDEVTERLGYSTVPNFIRAFRRWTGATPAAYGRARDSTPASVNGGGGPAARAAVEDLA